MITDIGVIVCALITTIGMILGVYVLDKKWYKRETHKTQMDFIRKENSIKLKKLERDLGLRQTATKTTTSSESGSLASLLPPLLKAMTPEQVQDLAGMILGGGESSEGTDSGDLISKLITVAEEHPDLLKAAEPFIKGWVNRTQQQLPTAQTGSEEGFI